MESSALLSEPPSTERDWVYIIDIAIIGGLTFVCVIISIFSGGYVLPGAPYAYESLAAAWIALRAAHYTAPYLKYRALTALYAALLYLCVSELTRALFLNVSNYFIATMGDLESIVAPQLAPIVIIAGNVLLLVVVSIALIEDHARTPVYSRSFGYALIAFSLCVCAFFAWYFNIIATLSTALSLYSYYLGFSS